ncbi:MAG: hypothetical protein ACI4OY_04735 [Aristaeellaceae bacterium]
MRKRIALKNKKKDGYVLPMSSCAPDAQPLQDEAMAAGRRDCSLRHGWNNACFTETVLNPQDRIFLLGCLEALKYLDRPSRPHTAQAVAQRYAKEPSRIMNTGLLAGGFVLRAPMPAVPLW